MSATAQAVMEIRESGWTLLKGVIPEAPARDIRYVLFRVGACCGVIATLYVENKVRPPFYTRPTVIKDEPRIAPWLLDERVAGVIDGALGADALVTSTTMDIHEPRTVAGEWHTGEPYDAVSRAVSSPGRHLTLHWFFSPFREDNGGLPVIAGSHRSGERGREHVITGGLGDVAILDSRLLRRVAANPSDVMRLSVIVGLSADAVPSVDPASFVPQVVYDKFPPQAQRLFRYFRR